MNKIGNRAIGAFSIIAAIVVWAAASLMDEERQLMRLVIDYMPSVWFLIALAILGAGLLCYGTATLILGADPVCKSCSNRWSEHKLHNLASGMVVTCPTETLVETGQKYPPVSWSPVSFPLETGQKYDSEARR